MMYVTNCKTIQLIRNNIIFLVLVLFSLTNSYSLKSNVKFQTNLVKLATSIKDTKTLFISEDLSSNTDFYHDEVLSGSILIDEDGKLSFDENFYDIDSKVPSNKQIVARAKYTKSLFSLGWSRLFIETIDNASPEIQSWAAGYLEGRLTAKEIREFYNNLVNIHSEEKSVLSQVFDYYDKVEKSIRNKTSKQMLKNYQQEDLEYWLTIAMIQAQTDGLMAGHNSARGVIPIKLSEIYFINADGEVPELISVFQTKNLQSQTDFRFRQQKIKKFSKEYLLKYFNSNDPEFIWQKLMSNSHCTAVIKVLFEDNQEDKFIKDVLVSHTTWDSFSEMHRIYKIYKFSFTLLNKSKENIISFSSYPGTLTSTDDYYMTNAGLVVLETTLEILDKDLYNKVGEPDNHIPNYIRIFVSNRLAKTAYEWTQIFKKNNGGTYNSQWMVIDMNKINEINDEHRKMNSANRKKTIFSMFLRKNNDYFQGNIKNSFKDLFYVLEQIPEFVKISDMTNELLSKGYWASYNRPYFPEVSTKSGYSEMMRRYGKTYSYIMNPRSRIIASKIKDVKNIHDMQRLMQYNGNTYNYIKHSLEESGNGISTISPRYDLVPDIRLRKPAGGIDTKITNQKLSKNLSCLAISGPTKQEGLPPFNWEDWKTEPHEGLPNLWNFDWIKIDKKFVLN